MNDKLELQRLINYKGKIKAYITDKNVVVRFEPILCKRYYIYFPKTFRNEIMAKAYNNLHMRNSQS